MVANNCTKCKGAETDYPITTAVNASFLFVTNNTYSECLTTCPVSTSPLTQKGWYGSIKTQTCYQCPGGCSNCNIQITINDQNIVCTDSFCS